jgi:hypothetical protein
MHRTTLPTALVGTALLAALAAGSAAADTTGGPTDVTSASGSTQTDSAYGSVSLSRDNLTGQASINTGTYTFAVVQCADGSAGTRETYWNGQAPVSSYSFGKNLSSATVTASVDGTREVIDSCDGSDVVSAWTRAVSMSLSATTIQTKSTSRTIAYNSDGTKTIYTSSDLSYWAAGSVTFDGAAYPVQSPNLGSISHETTTAKTGK